jgi:hypothetical protein
VAIFRKLPNEKWKMENGKSPIVSLAQNQWSLIGKAEPYRNDCSKAATDSEFTTPSEWILTDAALRIRRLPLEYRRSLVQAEFVLVKEGDDLCPSLITPCGR